MGRGKGERGRRRAADQLNFVPEKESEKEALKAKIMDADKARGQKRRTADRRNLAHGE